MKRSDTSLRAANIGAWSAPLLLLLGAADAWALSSTISTGWDGAGQIGLTPAGGTYPRRSTVTLTANPAPGWVFDHWGGDLEGSSNPTTIRVRRDIEAIAFFRCTTCGDANGPFVAGQVYEGRNGYIEYIAGDLPILISAPHGGYLTPSEIPDRTYGTTTGDAWTQELIRAVQSTFQASFGGSPHIVINRLDRIKLDANRDLEEAAQSDPEAMQAWDEFHAFLDAAALEITQAFGGGLYIDLHGQSDDPERLQLGYLLYADELSLSDSELDAAGLASETSIRSLAASVTIPFSELLRGPQSLGGLLESLGYPAVPSPTSPDPGRSVYYSGGYNTATHGSLEGGTVDGIQIESNMDVRSDSLARSEFALALGETAKRYLEVHYSMPIGNQ